MFNSQVFTECKSCVFAKELDCTLGKLPLFKLNGGIVTTKDENAVILGRQCNFKRPQSWLDKFSNNISSQLKLETDIKYGVIINSFSIDTLTQGLAYILSQAIMPQALYVIYNNPDINTELSNIQNLLNNTKLKWVLKCPLEQPKHEFEFINEYIMAGTVKEGFVLYLNDKHLPYPSLIEKINDSINNLLKQVMVYIDYDYIFTSTVLVHIFGFDYLTEAIVNHGHGDKISRIN